MSDEMNIEVKRHGVKLDSNYAEWLRELKNRYRQSQVKAAVKVNAEKLLFNWQLGRDLVMRKAEERWGSGVVEQVSLDLQKEFPGDGFSANNLWMMKRWYMFYAVANQDYQKLEQPVQELQLSNNQPVTKLDQVGQELIDEFESGVAFPSLFAFVPWRHHVEILKKCKDIDEALYYICRTIEGGWSRNFLLDRIKSDEFRQKEHHAVNNFTKHLPLPKAQLAEELTKENYDLGFVSLPPQYSEKQLEDALCEQLTRFLLELGTGFAFIGRQKELIIAGKTRRIDLLFYHIRLRSYVVVELKSVAFEPEFAGKLNFYVNAVDEIIKHPDDNPTIGLLICRDKDMMDVQLAFRGITTPLGVASYSNVQIAEIVKQLPTVEQLQERIEFLENELKEKQ